MTNIFNLTFCPLRGSICPDYDYYLEHSVDQRRPPLVNLSLPHKCNCDLDRRHDRTDPDLRFSIVWIRTEDTLVCLQVRARTQSR